MKRILPWVERQVSELPHQVLVRLLVDALALTGVFGLAVFAKAWAVGALPPLDPFPWGLVIQGSVTVLTAILAWLIRGQVQQLHLTINSKMDALLALTATAAKAEGILEERARGESLVAAKSAGVAEGLVGLAAHDAADIAHHADMTERVTKLEAEQNKKDPAP